MASQITQITNKQNHDKVVDESENTPTIIYVSNSALPVCKEFSSKYEALADKHNQGRGGERPTRFCQMEITSETSAMFKFSPNQLPVVVLLCSGPWSRTMMSPSIQQLESGIEEMLQKAGKLRN